MSGFTKLFSTIITSSIWSEDAEVCKVWVTFLALAESDGFVAAALPGISNAARLPMERTAEIIKKLESPDPFSRSTAHDGRRIERCEGGWLILNYSLYRETRVQSPLLTDKDSTYHREYMRRRRAQGKLTKQLTCVNPYASASASASVSVPEGGKPPPWTREEFDAAAKYLSVPDKQRNECWAYYDRQGWVTGGATPKRIQGDPRSTLTTWLANESKLSKKAGGKNGTDLSQWEITNRLEAIKAELQHTSAEVPNRELHPKRYESYLHSETHRRRCTLKQERDRLKKLQTGV